MIRRFAESERSGFYLSVAREGTVVAGDPLVRIARDSAGVTLLEAFRAYVAADAPPAAVRRVLEAASLPDDWRGRLRKRLEASTA